MAVTPENEEGTRKYTRLNNQLFPVAEQSPAVSAEAADRINTAFTQAINKTELNEAAKAEIAQKFVLPSNIDYNSYEAEKYARDFADDAALAYEAGEIQQQTGEKLPDGWLQRNMRVATPEQVDYYTKLGREHVLAEQVEATSKVDTSNYDTFNSDDKYSRGTNLEYSERYSYKNLTSKSDIEVKKLPRLSETEIKKYQNDSILFGKDMRSIAAKSNNAKNTPTKTYIYCSDLGKDVLITRNSFKHGAARMDGTYIAVCKSIAEVLNNSIVVNELTDREYTQGGYVLLGLTETDDSYVVVRSIVNKKTWQLEDYNELYAVKKKSIKKEDVGLKPPHYVHKNGYVTSSVISILDFLKFVNSQNIGNNVLSLDVIKNLGSTRGVDEKITPNLMYKISPIKKVGQSVKSDTIPTNNSISQSAQNVNKESLAIEAKKYTADTTERVQARKKLLARSADEVRTATRNDTTLTAEQREAAEFGEKIGVAVGFVDTTQYYRTKRDGISLKSKGVIILDKKTKNPLKQVFIHELAHFSETSKTYAKLSRKIMESKALDNWLTEKGYTGSFANKKSAYRAAKKNAYSENGEVLTKDGADAEMIADFLGETIGTEEKFNAFMSELTGEQKKNFLDYIKEVIDWFKATFTNSVPAEIRNIERLYKKALREARDVAKSKLNIKEQGVNELDSEYGDVQFVIGGKKSVDNKELKRYNDRGWAENLLSEEDHSLLKEKIQEAFIQKFHKRLKDGTKVIEVNNKIVFVSGTFDNPVIDVLFAFNSYNADYDEVQKQIILGDKVYGNYTKQDIKNWAKVRGVLYGNEIFVAYCREDYISRTIENVKKGRRATLPESFKSYGHTGRFTIRNGVYVKDEESVSGRYEGYNSVTEDEQFSISDRKFNEAFITDTLQGFGITKPKDYIHVQRQVFSTLLNEGFFTDKEKRSRVDINKASGMIIETNKKSIDKTFSESTYKNVGINKKIAKLATIRKIPQIITNGSVVGHNIPNQYGDANNKSFAYIEGEITLDGKKILLKLDIKKSREKNKFYVHNIVNIENIISLSDGTQKAQGRTQLTDDAKNTISQSTENVNTEQFSIPGEELVERKERTYGNSIPERTRKLRQDYADGKIGFDELVAGEAKLMEEAREKYGTIEEGENPQERVKVPQSVEKNKNVSQYVRTILETGVVSEALAAEIGEKTLLGEFSHKVATDKKALEDAEKAIKNGTAKVKWYTSVGAIHSIPTKNEIAVGEKLLEKAMKDGKTINKAQIIETAETKKPFPVGRVARGA